MNQIEEPPGLTIPAHKIQEMAQLIWLSQRALLHYERAGRDRAARRQAARDVLAAKDAIRATTGDPAAATDDVPAGLDPAAFDRAEQLAAAGQERSAQVTSLAPLGSTTWAAHGHVPGVGRVGIEVATWEQAEVMRQQFLTAPAAELAEFAVREQPPQLDTRYHRIEEQAVIRGEYPDLVATLDPQQDADRTLARGLVGRTPELNQALTARFGPGILTEATEMAEAAEKQAADKQAAAEAEAVQQQANERVGDDQRVAGQTQQAEASLGDDQRLVAMVEEIPASDGSILRIDPEVAMQLYPAPNAERRRAVEYRAADGSPLPSKDVEQMLIAAIPQWDDSNPEHRQMAVDVWGNSKRVDAALADRFVGLRTALQGHADAEIAAQKGAQAQQQGATHAAQASRARKARQEGTPAQAAAAGANTVLSSNETAAQQKQRQPGTSQRGGQRQQRAGTQQSAPQRSR